jgi:amino acid transporter
MKNKKHNDSSNSHSSGGRFGTFGGVFTPCVLTILGVIMFMRTGYVTGIAGLWATLAILGLAEIITTLTTLSISAIATNLDMRVGGVYFMISRVLGPDFGGSIGITLFAANAVGVAFYTIGFTEALTALLGIQNVIIGRIIATVVATGLFAMTFKGADIVIKVQYVVLLVLLLAVASFMVGGFLDFDHATLRANMKPSAKLSLVFWPAFAIFFPAATGITAGANMSGDLKNPGKSIPSGTLLAILFTVIIYATQIVLTAGSAGRADLIADGYGALQKMSIFSPLIILGVWAATLSSALGSFLGAPRILQAMGQDRLMKSMVFFGKGSGDNNEPRRATVLTFIIAIGVIWAGDLNAVAEVISMFFLIAYGMINLSAFVESKSSNPSFRPKFRFFHWTTALAGAIGCSIAMIKINETYAIIALGITAIIYFYLKKRDIQTSFGDAKRGYIFQRTRDNLLYLEQAKTHPKNWRPILVVVTQSPVKDAQLIRFGSWVESQRGLYTVAYLSIKPGESLVEKIATRKRITAELKRQLDADGVIAFSEAVVVDEYFKGLPIFLQSYSIGGLRPNTMLVKLPDQNDILERETFLKTMDMLSAFDMNLLVLKPGDFALNRKRRTIDLWWRGKENGSLMSLFAYLITLDKNWSNATLRILRIVQNEADVPDARKKLEELKEAIRISARIEIIVSSDPPVKTIANTSGPVADLILIGIAAPNGEKFRNYLDNIGPVLDSLPTTLFVWSNGDADILA